MRSLNGTALLGVLALATPLTHSKAQFDASLAAFADTEQGSSLDLDASLSPGDWLTLSAGVGTSESPDDRAGVSADSFRFSADVHSQRFGLRGYYQNWSDSGNFESETVGVRPYFRNAGLTLELIGEARTLDVGFTVRALGRPVDVSRSFDGTGVGASVSYYGARWGGYAEGLFYDYDESLDQLIAAANGPNIDRFPRIQALVGSLLTLTQGALDHELALGIERSAARSSVRLEWVMAEDAIDGLTANSLSVSFLYAFTRHVDVEITLGASDTDSLGSMGFGGVTFGFHR